MTHIKKRPDLQGIGPASGNVYRAKIDNPDSSDFRLTLQANRLLGRFKFSPALALAIAELAYDHRRPV